MCYFLFCSSVCQITIKKNTGSGIFPLPLENSPWKILPRNIPHPLLSRIPLENSPDVKLSSQWEIKTNEKNEKRRNSGMFYLYSKTRANYLVQNQTVSGNEI